MKSSKDRYAAYLKTDYWKAVERAVKERAGYRCQICNSQHDLQAHHRTYDHRGSELEHLGDLTCLCRRCHAIFHGQLTPPPTPPPTPKPISVKPETPGRTSKRERRELRRLNEANTTNVKPHTEADVDRIMPDGVGDIALTKELIIKCRTFTGGFTSATVNAFEPQDLIAGWPDRLVGKVLTREKYREAVKGRYIYATKRFQKVPEPAP